MKRHVDHAGYNSLIPKPDPENSLIDIMNATKRDRTEHIETGKEDSSAGEHPENGKLERAIHTLQGQTRTTKMQ